MLPRCSKKYRTPTDQQLKLQRAGREWEGSHHLRHHDTCLPRLPERKAGLSEGEVLSIWQVPRGFHHMISAHLVTQATPARSRGRPQRPQSPIWGCLPTPHPRGHFAVTVSSSHAPWCMPHSVAIKCVIHHHPLPKALETNYCRLSAFNAHQFTILPFWRKTVPKTLTEGQQSSRLFWKV